MGSALSSQRESQRISEPAELTADGLPEQISQSIAVLAETAGEWHAMPDEERAAVVRECRARLATLPMDWVADNMRCLGLGQPHAGATQRTKPTWAPEEKSQQTKEGRREEDKTHQQRNGVRADLTLLHSPEQDQQLGSEDEDGRDEIVDH